LDYSNLDWSLRSTFNDKGSTLDQNKVEPPSHRKTLSRTLPTSDTEIESAGAAFLVVIGKSIGLR
jgi:hypothetical protein